MASRLIIALLFTLLCTPLVQAEGNYYVGRDEGGIYFQTDNHGGRYIDRADLKNFKIGETGKYQIDSDKYGTYMLIDKPRKFYIDLEGREQGEREVEQFNRKQEKLAYKNETKVLIKGNQVLVPVTLGYDSSKTEALLVLVTGASITLLYQQIAAQIGIRKTRKSIFRLAGGQEITANVAKLDYVKVGSCVKENLYAGFIEFKGPAMRSRAFLA